MQSIYDRDRVPAMLAIGDALSTEYGKAMFLAIYEEDEELVRRREKSFEFAGKRLSDEKVRRENDVTWSAGVAAGLWDSLVAYIALSSGLHKVQVDHELFNEFGHFRHGATAEQVEAMRIACKTRLKVWYR